MRNVLLFTAVLPVFVLACESYPAADSAKNEGRVSVTTSALSLPSITDVCYTIEVRNERGDVVWSKPDICSSRYGDGRGDISYVGPCDASSATNDVSLTLTSMKDASGALVTDATNPCPPGAACTQKAVCQENKDTAVDFNLTVMRSGGQGFFDVAVNFDEFQCSAKLDCQDAFLTDPETGERTETAVLAFACSNGEAMRMSDVTLDCTTSNGQPIVLRVDPSKEGNHFVHGDPHVDGLSQVSSFVTRSSSSTSWSVAIAPDLDDLDKMGVTSCRLHAAATATNDRSTDWKAPENYPFVTWDVAIVSPRDAASGLPTGKRLGTSCGSNPLNGAKSGVTTSSVGKKEYVGHVTLMK